uniref:Uncharacterized protein n=1 Tax=Rhizophora mucronata TaxID=61149 RepID=A0A2P2NSA0_RHIMU
MDCIFNSRMVPQKFSLIQKY